jgi:hypothetical protein
MHQRKSSRWRSWRTATAAASVLVLILGGLGGTGVAQANTSGSITASRNSSDPQLIRCPRADLTGDTLCLFASQDMGDQTIPYFGNYYPMNQTVMWRLKDGADASRPANWDYQGAVVTESKLAPYGVGTNTFHQWAPGAKWYGNRFLLFIPDVLDINDQSHSSRIFLFTSADRFGTGFTGAGKVQTPSTPNSGYASDPDLFIHPNGAMFLDYANGDNSNCGGISLSQLDPADLTRPLSTTELSIDGMAGDFQFGPACTGNHPYLEGPSMYLSTAIGLPSSSPKYTLIFAAKPKDRTVPAPCAATGSTSDKEVIAYAQSLYPTGPWQYKGIMMCGSDSEWTNQASIVQHPTVTVKYLFAWHDGGDTAHNRRTHLMCVRWDANGKAIQIPRSPANLSNCG